MVTISLRRATSEYIQAYVSISNRGDGPATIDPGRITVENAETENTFSAYPPGEAPAVVRRAAKQSSSEFVGMDRLTASGEGAIYGATEGETGSRGSYGSESGDDISLSDLMLQSETLPAQQATSGLVFTPFTGGLKEFTINVPVDETTHSFQFRVERAE